MISPCAVFFWLGRGRGGGGGGGGLASKIDSIKYAMCPTE